MNTSETSTIDKRIISALSALGLKTSKSSYTGTDTSYFVFSHTSSPFFFADDEPEFLRYVIEIHLITPVEGNINSLIDETTEAIVNAGFSYPSIQNMSDEKRQEIVWQTEEVEYVNHGDI